MHQGSRTRTAVSRAAIALAAFGLALLLPVAALAAGGWQARTSGTAQNLVSLAALAGGHRWAVGAGGVILVSQNEGASWTPQTSGTTSDLRGVAFADATHGWAVGAGGMILATSDGGTTWAPQASGSTLDLSGVACSGANTAWAVGAGGTILATTDGGTTWAPRTSGTVQDLRTVASAGGSNGAAVGAAGTIVTTADGGATWTIRTSGSSRDLAAVTFGDTSQAWAVGAGGTILRTADGGATWTAQTATTANDLAAVAFGDPRHGAVAGSGGTILTTKDGGIIDSSAPRTTTTGLQTKATKGWRHTSQVVTLRATDAASGVAATYYKLDGAAKQTYTAPFTIAAPGSHVVKYWSADWAGNVEAKRTGYVNIDVSKPVCRALANVKTYAGSNAKFSYRVDDAKPTSGAGSVSIAIVKGGKTVKRLKIPRVSFNKAHTYTWRASLKSGKYTWVVTATDLAGNVQRKKGTARLSVTTMPLPTIADVQRRLITLHYLPTGAVTGKSDYRTSQAIMAFQAWTGLARDGVAGVETRRRLQKASAPSPRPVGFGGHYVQVFRSLGVALCVDNGTLVRAVHCSTGKPGYATVTGTHNVYLKSTRYWSATYSSWMPYASFFTGGYGLHGYGDVPAYPASHGCVRLPMPEASWVYYFAAMGTPVIVY